MEFWLVAIIVLMLIYPYWLILRLLQLACKALKTYIRKNEKILF